MVLFKFGMERLTRAHLSFFYYFPCSFLSLIPFHFSSSLANSLLVLRVPGCPAPGCTLRVFIERETEEMATLRAFGFSGPRLVSAPGYLGGCCCAISPPPTLIHLIRIPSTANITAVKTRACCFQPAAVSQLPKEEHCLNPGNGLSAASLPTAFLPTSSLPIASLLTASLPAASTVPPFVGQSIPLQC